MRERGKPFLRYFSEQLEILLGRGLTCADGFSEEELKCAESAAGFALPDAMRAYFAVAGHLAINKLHNVLYNPDDMFVMDEMIVFMEENQRVVFWGFRAQDVQSCDPLIYQAANTEEKAWYSEDMPFSEFIMKMWKWEKEGNCI